jgi:flagellar hook assembly protein FlgD
MLLSGSQPAGARTVTWDGRDDSGVRMAPGAYVVRMEMANRRESRTVRLVR